MITCARRIAFPPPLQFRRHQCRDAAGPGDPGVALLQRKAKHQRFRPGAIHQRAFFLLDRQLAFLRLIDRQCGAGLEVGRAVCRALKSAVATRTAPLLVGIGHLGAACIGGGGVDRTIAVDHQPTGFARLLDGAARQAGMGGIGAFRQTFHDDWDTLNILVINVFIDLIQLIIRRDRAILGS